MFIYTIYQCAWKTYIFLLEGGIIEDVENTGHLGHDSTETQRIANGRQPRGDLETRFRVIQLFNTIIQILLNTSTYVWDKSITVFS